jgi:hypothetical protein
MDVAGVARELRDAVVRVCHIGGCSVGLVGGNEERAEGECEDGRLSLVVAICVRREARRRRSSWELKVWISSVGSTVGGGAG